MDSISVAGETIHQKALRLHRAGCVTREHGAVYRVRDGRNFRVDLYRGECQCGTPSCEHAGAAEIAQAKLNARTARRLEIARERAKDRGPGFDGAQIVANIERFGGAA